MSKMSESPIKKSRALPASSTTSSVSSCSICNEEFDSRNKLFKHLAICRVIDGNKRDADNTTISKYLEDNKDGDIYLYVLGGRLRGRTLRTCERYSFRMNKWEETIHLEENRGSHTAAGIVNKGLVYVLGGGGMQSNLNSGEVFSIKSNKWSPIPPSSKARHAHSSCSVIFTEDHHQLYVIGGWIDGKECTSSIECYDSIKNVWEEKNSLVLPRKLFGSTYHKGTNSIYCFGGLIDNLLCTNRVEAYSLDKNCMSECVTLPFVGSTSAITTNKDQIYVVIHGKAIVLYDPLLQTFTILATLPLKEWFCFDISYFGMYSLIYSDIYILIQSPTIFRRQNISSWWCC